jgi:hypothetical protein
VERVADGKRLRWNFTDLQWEKSCRWWVIQALIEGKWQTIEVAYHTQHETDWPTGSAAVAVRAAGPAWELSPPGVISAR